MALFKEAVIYCSLPGLGSGTADVGGSTPTQIPLSDCAGELRRLLTQQGARLTPSLCECTLAVLQHAAQPEVAEARSLKKPVRSVLWVLASLEARSFIEEPAASLHPLLRLPPSARATGADGVVASLTGFSDLSRTMAGCLLRVLGLVASKSMHVAVTTHLLASRPEAALGASAAGAGGRDAKLAFAAARGIRVMGVRWALDSLAAWEMLDAQRPAYAQGEESSASASLLAAVRDWESDERARQEVLGASSEDEGDEGGERVCESEAEEEGRDGRMGGAGSPGKGARSYASDQDEAPAGSSSEAEEQYEPVFAAPLRDVAPSLDPGRGEREADDTPQGVETEGRWASEAGQEEEAAVGSVEHLEARGADETREAREIGDLLEPLESRQLLESRRPLEPLELHQPLEPTSSSHVDPLSTSPSSLPPQPARKRQGRPQKRRAAEADENEAQAANGRRKSARGREVPPGRPVGERPASPDTRASAQPRAPAPPAPEPAAVSARAPCVALSGWHRAEQARLEAGVREAGGRAVGGMSSHAFPPGATHVVAPRLLRTVKCMGGLAAGLWLLGPGFVEGRSEVGSEERHVLAEGSGEVEPDVAARWQAAVARGKRRAFEGMRVRVVPWKRVPGQPAPKDVEQVLKAGGAALALGASSRADLVVARAKTPGAAWTLAPGTVMDWLARPNLDLGAPAQGSEALRLALALREEAAGRVSGRAEPRRAGPRVR